MHPNSNNLIKHTKTIRPPRSTISSRIRQTHNFLQNKNRFKSRSRHLDETIKKRIKKRPSPWIAPNIKTNRHYVQLIPFSPSNSNISLNSHPANKQPKDSINSNTNALRLIIHKHSSKNKPPFLPLNLQRHRPTTQNLRRLPLKNNKNNRQTPKTTKIHHLQPRQQNTTFSDRKQTLVLHRHT